MKHLREVRLYLLLIPGPISSDYHLSRVAVLLHVRLRLPAVHRRHTCVCVRACVRACVCARACEVCASGQPIGLRVHGCAMCECGGNKPGRVSSARVCACAGSPVLASVCAHACGRACVGPSVRVRVHERARAPASCVCARMCASARSVAAGCSSGRARALLRGEGQPPHRREAREQPSCLRSVWTPGRAAGGQGISGCACRRMRLRAHGLAACVAVP